MSKLLIKKKEYKNAVLATDFINKTKKAFLKENITDYKFAPQINGYKILYTKNGEKIIITIKFRKVFFGIKIQTTKQIGKKCFCSKSPEENAAAIGKII